MEFETQPGEVNVADKENHFRALIVDEVSKVSNHPERDLRYAIRDWLKFRIYPDFDNQPDKTQKSLEDRFDKTLTEIVEKSETQSIKNGKNNIVARVAKLYLDGDTIGAVELFVNTRVPVSLNGSINKSLKASRRTAAIVFATSKKEKGVVLREKPSPVFGHGTVAHEQIEQVVLAEADLAKIYDSNTILNLNSDGLVAGISVYGVEQVSDAHGKVKIKDVVSRKQKQTIFLSSDNQILRRPKTVKIEKPITVSFQVPLEPPGAMPISDWLKKLFWDSLQAIVKYYGTLPSRPFDVQETLANKDVSPDLIRAIEGFYILFGPKSDSSSVTWASKTDGLINSNTINIFSALNSISIMRKILDTKTSLKTESGKKESGVLNELSEADIKLSLKVKHDGLEEDVLVPIDGKEIDTFRVSFDVGIEPNNSPIKELSQVLEYLNGQFRSQNLKFRTYEFKDGVRKLKSTRLNRNVESLLRGLYAFYGDAIFNHLHVDIDDYKLLVGDGTYSEVESERREGLPEQKYVRQVSGYIFKTLAQFCSIKKWLDLNKSGEPGNETEYTFEQVMTGKTNGKLVKFVERGEIALTVEEVIDFAISTGLIDRVKSHLLYQFPGQEIVFDVGPKGAERDELIKWAIWASKLDKPLIEQRQRLQVVRGVLELLRPKVESLTVVRKPNKDIPENLKEICEIYNDKVYLTIDSLARVLSEKSKSRLIQDFNAIHFTDSNIKVMWVEGLVGKGVSVRLAIDVKSGRFSLSVPGQERVTGMLLSTLSNWGVRHNPERLAALFDEQVWNLLPDFKLPEPQKATDAFYDGKVVMPDGRVENLVPGKPVVCKYDLLTGMWYLDYKLLEQAVASDASRTDHVGIYDLADRLNNQSGLSRAIFCPIPTHNNKNTPAAIFNHNNINCQSGECGEHIYLPPRKGKIRVNSEPLVKTHSVQDYKFISPERTGTITSLMEIGTAFAANIDVPNRYIVQERGLSQNDIGTFAYLPMELDVKLSQVVFSDSFTKIVKSVKHADGIQLDQLTNLVDKFPGNDTEKVKVAIKGVLEIINTLPPTDRQSVLKNLNVKTLIEMKRRGIFEQRNKPGSTEKVIVNRLGERILIPTYWISAKSKGPILVPSNFNGRGIELGGKVLYNEQPHHKARVGGRAGTKIPPVGFWFRDADKFLASVKDQVVVLEGIYNAATLARMVPELSNISLTNVGLGYSELIAFLRWLGVKGDKSKEMSEIGAGIKQVVLAFDFDVAGATSFVRKRAYLKSEFPSLNVIPIHKFLPPDVLAIVPPYDPKLFAKPDPGKKKKAGPLYGTKLDFNDMINKNAEANPVLIPIREKYAYKP